MINIQPCQKNGDLDMEPVELVWKFDLCVFLWAVILYVFGAVLR